MHQVFLGIGSNLGDREKAISDSIEKIGLELGEIIQISSTIETPAWGKTDSPDYLNAVIEIKTHLLPLALIKAILEIEAELGRVRTEKWASRVIDIDMLYFNDWYFQTPDLIIPHPFISERLFVLEPLVNISPNFKHPIHLKSNLELLEKMNNEN